MPFASASAANERLLLVVEILSRTDTRYQIPDTRYKAQDTFTYSHAANWLLCVSVRVCVGNLPVNGVFITSYQ